jgi:hypothetical protein
MSLFSSPIPILRRSGTLIEQLNSNSTVQSKYTTPDERRQEKIREIPGKSWVKFRASTSSGPENPPLSNSMKIKFIFILTDPSRFDMNGP